MNKETKRENFAIVIGIDKYPDEAWNLKGAVTDAIQFADWLTKPNPIGGDVPRNDTHLHLLLSPEKDSLYKKISYELATAENVDDSITSIAKSAESVVNEDSRLFFYFAGHGVTTPYYELASEAAILLSDFTLKQSSRTSMMISSIREFFKSTNISYQFFFFDACRDIPWAKRFKVGSTSNAWQEDGHIVHQFVYSATAPFKGTPEIRGALQNGGAFTWALLEGLTGHGTAKKYDEGEDKYFVRVNTLRKFIEQNVSNQLKKIGIDPSGMLPQLDGHNIDADYYLASFDSNNVPPQSLRVFLNSDTTIPKVDVQVLIGNTPHSNKTWQTNKNPAIFSLQPRTYGVTALVSGYEVEGGRVATDVYEDKDETIRLIPTASPSSVDYLGAGGNRIGAIAKLPSDRLIRGVSRRSISPYALRENRDSAAKAIIPTVKSNSVRVFSNDSQAPIELANSSGKLIATGIHEIQVSDLAPGTYRASLVSPEGFNTEELITLDKHQTITVNLKSQSPYSVLNKNILAKGSFNIDSINNELEVSEMVGPISTPSLSTILLLAGRAAAYDKNVWSANRLRSLGHPDIRSTYNTEGSMIQILFGSEVENNLWFGKKLIFNVYQKDSHQKSLSFRLEPFSNVSNLFYSIHPLFPGHYLISLELPNATPVFNSICLLKNCVTMLILDRQKTGKMFLYQYIVPLVTEGLSPNVETKYLRNLDIIHRFYANGRYDHVSKRLLAIKKKPLDPIGAGLASLMFLRPEKNVESKRLKNLEKTSKHMIENFSGLSDSHVLFGEYLTLIGRDGEAQNSFINAISIGVPIFRENLVFLYYHIKGILRKYIRVKNYDIFHDYIKSIDPIIQHSLGNTLWSAWRPRH